MPKPLSRPPQSMTPEINNHMRFWDLGNHTSRRWAGTGERTSLNVAKQSEEGRTGIYLARTALRCTRTSEQLAVLPGL